MAENRTRWGCDKPAPAGQGYSIPCTRCDGRDRACRGCGGKGFEAVDRCPSWHLRQRGVTDVIRAWGWMEQRGHLPAAGGTMDQTRCFLQAAAHLSSVTETHRAREASKRGRHPAHP